MKVTYNWLKDFVEIKLSPEALAEKLTMAGIEVKAVEEKAGDFVFEIEITSNRPDWLSVIGIAREVAAITNAKLKIKNEKLQFKIKNFKKEKALLRIDIEDKKDCPLYTAKIIRDVRVGPSPAWLRKRLELIGCRSVNNIVDITNYVLFEYGEPLHAFDLDKLVLEFLSSRVLELGINIRRAKKEERIVTIDGIERVLDENILIIAAGTHEPANSRTRELFDRPVAIAGIMGGKDTEVTASTQNVLLEAAVFNPILIRRGRQQLGIQTDSSYRFERGVDQQTAELAPWRAVQLIKEIAGGTPVLAMGAYLEARPPRLTLNIDSVQRILGVNIPASVVKKILISLGFSAKPKSGNRLMMQAPLFRQDIAAGIDLVEEISRIYGYENIPTTLPAVKPQLITQAAQDAVRQTKNILVGLGLNEVITYSLLDADLLKFFAPLVQPVEIANPLSREQGVLRPSLIPGLTGCVAYNLNQKQGQVNIFEIAKTFTCPAGSTPKEELTLGIALCGMKSFWTGLEFIHHEPSISDLREILEAIFKRLGIPGYKFMLQGNCAEVEIYVKDTKVGILKALERKILDKLDIKNKEVFVAEVSLDKLFSDIPANKTVTPPSRYPGISRDISLVLKEDIPLEKVMEVVAGRGGNLLEEVNLTDYYKGKPIPPGFKGLTISCRYCSRARTLTEAEVNPIHADVIQRLKDTLQAEIR